MIGVYNKYLLRVLDRHLRYHVIRLYNKYLLGVICRHSLYYMIEVYNTYLLGVINRHLFEDVKSFSTQSEEEKTNITNVLSFNDVNM